MAGKTHAMGNRCRWGVRTEERGVKPRFDDRARERRPRLVDTCLGELWCAVRVMPIPGPMMCIDELARLSEGAENRVVATGALFLLVKTDGCTFGMLHGRQNASVEVQCGSRQSLLPEAHKYHVLRHLANIDDILRVGRGQRARDSGNVRKMVESKDPQHHWVVAVIVGIAKPAIAQDRVELHDE